ERAREVWLRLVILDDPFDGPAKQAAALVQLLDVDLADDLMHEARRGERSGQGERAADPDRRLGALRVCAGRQQRKGAKRNAEPAGEAMSGSHRGSPP